MVYDKLDPAETGRRPAHLPHPQILRETAINARKPIDWVHESSLGLTWLRSSQQQRPNRNLPDAFPNPAIPNPTASTNFDCFQLGPFWSLPRLRLLRILEPCIWFDLIPLLGPAQRRRRRRRGSGERLRGHGGLVSGGDGGLVGRREQLHTVAGPHLPRPRRPLRRRCRRSPSKPLSPRTISRSSA